jgi:hypothetical protein
LPWIESLGFFLHRQRAPNRLTNDEQPHCFVSRLRGIRVLLDLLMLLGQPVSHPSCFEPGQDDSFSLLFHSTNREGKRAISFPHQCSPLNGHFPSTKLLRPSSREWQNYDDDPTRSSGISSGGRVGEDDSSRYVVRFHGFGLGS